MRLGTRLQGAASQTARQAGLELSSLGAASGSSAAAAARSSSGALAGASGGAAGGGGGGGVDAGGGAAEGGKPAAAAGLEEDPDLEAYLQVGWLREAVGGCGWLRITCRCA